MSIQLSDNYSRMVIYSNPPSAFPFIGVLTAQNSRDYRENPIGQNNQIGIFIQFRTIFTSLILNTKSYEPQVLRDTMTSDGQTQETPQHSHWTHLRANMREFR